MAEGISDLAIKKLVERLAIKKLVVSLVHK